MLTILWLSLGGSVLAILLIGLRRALGRRLPKSVLYYLWLVVLLRLCLPVDSPIAFDGGINAGEARAQIQMQSAQQGGETALPATLTGQAAAPQPQEDLAGDAAAVQAGNATMPLEADSAAGEPDGLPAAAPWLKIGTAVWLLGALGLLSFRIAAYLRFSARVRRESVSAEAAVQGLFLQLGGTRLVEVLRCPLIDTPMLLGLLRHKIVLPQADYDTQTLAHILRHELCHYRRGDLHYKWFLLLVSCLHWFNPLMVLVRREISLCCELSCDAAVIAAQTWEERQAYGETLLTMAAGVGRRTPQPITALGEEKMQMRERIKGIVSYRKKTAGMALLSGLLAVLLLGCSALLGAPREAAAEAEEIDRRGEAVEARVPLTAQELAYFQNEFFAPGGEGHDYLMASMPEEQERAIRLISGEKDEVGNVYIYYHKSTWDTNNFPPYPVYAVQFYEEEEGYGFYSNEIVQGEGEGLAEEITPQVGPAAYYQAEIQFEQLCLAEPERDFIQWKTWLMEEATHVTLKDDGTAFYLVPYMFSARIIVPEGESFLMQPEESLRTPNWIVKDWERQERTYLTFLDTAEGLRYLGLLETEANLQLQGALPFVTEDELLEKLVAFMNVEPDVEELRWPMAMGADILYADESKVLFQWGRGIFAYDLQAREVTRAVDLQKIQGYSGRQGSIYASVQADRNGRYVRFGLGGIEADAWDMGLSFQSVYWWDTETGHVWQGEPAEDFVHFDKTGMGPMDGSLEGFWGNTVVYFSEEDIGYIAGVFEDLRYVRGDESVLLLEDYVAALS